MSWPIPSVRGNGRDQAGLALAEVLSVHLLSTSEFLSDLATGQGQARETTKHVDSFGVGSWIRVQFSAPPPFRLRIAEFGLRI